MNLRRWGRLLLEHLLPYYVLVSTPERKRYWGELPFVEVSNCWQQYSLLSPV